MTFLWSRKEKSLAHARRAGEIPLRAAPSCPMRRSRIKGLTAGSSVRINSAWIANVRIRCAIRTYDSITPGGYGFPHPDPLPRGEGTKTLGRQQAKNRKGAYQAPFLQTWSMACDPCRLIDWSRPSSLPQTLSDE